MPYRVLQGGVVECDSPEEAMDLAKLMANGTPPPAKNAEKRANADKSGAFTDFWRSLEDRGKLVLRTLAANFPKDVRAEDLALALEVDTSKLPGAIIHVRGAAQRAEIGEVITRSKKMEGQRLKSRYVISKKAWEALRNELAEKGSRG